MNRQGSRRTGRLTVLALAAGTLAACTGTHDVTQQTANPEGGTLTVSWAPPKQNTDGSPIADLVGYTLLYGPAPNTYVKAITIDDPKITRYVVSGLRPGTYYFAITARNSAGHQSFLSTEAHGVVK